MPRSPLRGARKIFQDRGPGDREANTAKGGLAFSWPLLGALSLFLICAIVWAFFMGFMVGQGHNPNTKIQEITGLTLSAPNADKDESHAEEETEATASPTNPPADIVPEQETSSQGSEKAEPAFRKPKGQELAAWGEDPVKSHESPPKKDRPPQTRKEKLFAFSFQIAAFKNLAEAENLQKKLAAISVKTKIQKSGKVQLLIADLRGPASTPETLRQKLIPLKLGKPLQLSKKELSTGAKRNR